MVAAAHVVCTLPCMASAGLKLTLTSRKLGEQKGINFINFLLKLSQCPTEPSNDERPFPKSWEAVTHVHFLRRCRRSSSHISTQVKIKHQHGASPESIALAAALAELPRWRLQAGWPRWSRAARPMQRSKWPQPCPLPSANFRCVSTG